MKLAILNSSTLVSDVDAMTMVQAVKRQLTEHALPAYGACRKSVELEFVPRGAQAPTDAFPIVLMDDPDQAGALGYHTEDPGGKAWGRVFAKPVLSNGGTVLTGSLSVSAVLSHEVLEASFDIDVNMWADRFDGTFVAKEACDPVESSAYDVQVQHADGTWTNVSVSDFVLPEWYNPQADPSSKFTWMGSVSAPLQMAPGGYCVVLNTNNGQVSQVFGSEAGKAAHDLKKPYHPAARSAKRGISC